MTLGRKRNRLKFWQRQITVNSGGEHIEQFVVLGEQYAEINPRTAREVNGTVLVEQNTFDVDVKYTDKLAAMRAADQITFRGDTYELTGAPMNLGGRDRDLRIPTRLVVPSGVGNG